NLVQGVIDHHILHVHHVVEAENHLTWDLVFLGSSLLLIGPAVWSISADHSRPATSRSPPVCPWPRRDGCMVPSDSSVRPPWPHNPRYVIRNAVSTSRHTSTARRRYPVPAASEFRFVCLP